MAVLNRGLGRRHGTRKVALLVSVRVLMLVIWMVAMMLGFATVP